MLSYLIYEEVRILQTFFSFTKFLYCSGLRAHNKSGKGKWFLRYESRSEFCIVWFSQYSNGFRTRHYKRHFIPTVVWCTHCTVERDCIIEGLKQQLVSNLTFTILFADRLVRQLLLLSTLTKCTPLCSLHEWRVLLHIQKSHSKKHFLLSQLLHE